MLSNSKSHKRKKRIRKDKESSLPPLVIHKRPLPQPSLPTSQRCHPVLEATDNVRKHLDFPSIVITSEDDESLQNAGSQQTFLPPKHLHWRFPQIKDSDRLVTPLVNRDLRASYAEKMEKSQDVFYAEKSEKSEHRVSFPEVLKTKSSRENNDSS
jgi:hypothetical protein